MLISAQVCSALLTKASLKCANCFWEFGIAPLGVSPGPLVYQVLIELLLHWSTSVTSWSSTMSHEIMLQQYGSNSWKNKTIPVLQVLHTRACDLIQRPERWFRIAPVLFWYRWQYKAIHWLEQTEHRKRTRWQPKTIYCSLQTEKGFNRQALSSNRAAARQFRPHWTVCPRLIRWKTSGIAPSFKFQRAWSDFTGVEWNFRWAESGLWAELSGITMERRSEAANTQISWERKFSPLSSAHMLCCTLTTRVIN